MAQEYWDLFDSSRKPLGRLHKRGQPIPEGVYCQLVQVLVINSVGQMLLTKRDASKPHYAGLWENSGGAVLAGESTLHAAVRELGEETGIAAAEDELTLLATCKEHDLFIDVYLAHKDVAIENIVLQPGETCDVKWVSLRELEAVIKAKNLAAPSLRRLQRLGDKWRVYMR